MEERSFYRFMRLLAFWLAASMRDMLRMACRERKEQEVNLEDRTCQGLSFKLKFALLQILPKAGCALNQCSDIATYYSIEILKRKKKTCFS